MKEIANEKFHTFYYIKVLTCHQKIKKKVKEEPKINPEIKLKSRLILLIYKNKLKSIIKILTWQQENRKETIN